MTDDELIATRWVHAFEEDTPEGQAYRPESGALPLSRRQRERLELRRDGTARLMLPGPSDRPEGVEGRWTEEGAEVVVRLAGAGAAAPRELRLRRRAPDLLLLCR